MKIWNTAKCSRITSPVLVMGLFYIRAATAMLEIEVEHGAMSTLTIGSIFQNSNVTLI